MSKHSTLVTGPESLLESLLSRGPRQANDRSVLAELDVRRAAAELPPGLTVEWLGTAGFRMTYAGTTVLVDPYLSRHGLIATVAKRSLFARTEAVASHVNAADAVLVGHTHFDHALDVPLICERHDATAYGSSSLSRLMGLYGLAHRSVEVVPGAVHSIGPFEVTFVRSLHSRLVAGLKVPFDGELSCDHLDELRGSAYRCGQTFGIHIAVAGVTFYHQGSANLLDDEIVHRGVDFFLAGISGRGFTRDYARRILSRLEPKVVVPHHFDDFFRPLGAPMGFSLNVNLGGFVEEVRRVSGDFQVRTLPPLTPWGS